MNWTSFKGNLKPHYNCHLSEQREQKAIPRKIIISWAKIKVLDEFPKNQIFKKSLCNVRKSFNVKQQMAVVVGCEEKKFRSHNPYETGEVLRLRLSLSKVFSRSTDFSKLQTEESPVNRLLRLVFGLCQKPCYIYRYSIFDYFLQLVQQWWVNNIYIKVTFKKLFVCLFQLNEEKKKRGLKYHMYNMHEHIFFVKI